MVVGHALHNDFKALKYVHPRSQTRDTTYVPNLLSQPGLHIRARVSLKELAQQLLHKKIQVCVCLGGSGEQAGLPSLQVGPRLWWGCACSSPSFLTSPGPGSACARSPLLPGVHLLQAPLSGLSPQLQARCLPLQPEMKPWSGQLLTPAPTVRRLQRPLLFKPRAAIFILFIFEGTG